MAPTILLRRSALALSRRAIARPVFPLPARPFTTSIARRSTDDKEVVPKPGETDPRMVAFEDIKTEEDLLPPGAEPGTVPTDVEQATGLERLEILGKMQGIDVFDMRPLDSSRKGTLDNPIVINAIGDEQFAGCTGCPADSHVVRWLRLDRPRPVERCPECGGVYRMNYIGPPDDPHAHHDPNKYEEPKTFADYVRPEYLGTPQPFYGEEKLD